MKWTTVAAGELRQMCMNGVSNADMAKHFGVPVAEIHAKRSQLGITIPKVAAMKGEKALGIDPEFEAATQEMDKAIFVSQLGTLLRKTRCGVKKLALTTNDCIKILFENGYEKPVDITADSYLAIVKDVCQALS